MGTVSATPRHRLGLPPWRFRAIVACGALAAAILIGTKAGHRSSHAPWRIGWEVDPPEQVADSAGRPTGVSVETVRQAARRRGIPLVWVRRNESSEAALRSGAVDLWPLMTITPERLKVLHITTPYLDSVTSYMVLGKSPFHRLEELADQSVGYISARPETSVPTPFNLDLIHRQLPQAKPVVIRTRGQLIAALCRREIEAAFIQQNAAIEELMTGMDPACGTQGFRMITPPRSRVSLGIGSTAEAAAVADALREEIDAMSSDGTLRELFSKWGYLSGRGVAFVDALRNSRQREQWMRNTAAALGLLCVLALWQRWRSSRESSRARRAEAALRTSADDSRQMEERLRLLAHALWCANDCISIIDNERRLIYVNEAFLRTYDYEEHELIGQPTTILRSSRAERAVDAEIAAAMAGENWRGELWNRSKTGREFPLSMATSRVRDERGVVVALVRVASDITDRRKAEEEYRTLQERYLQSQKLESVGQLAGGVAHDFNNLLTVILGYTKKLLVRTEQDSSIQAPLVHISAAATRAAILTRQLLTFSRRNAGEPRTISLDEIVVGIEPMLRRLIEEHIELTLCPEADRGFIFADPAQMEQVVVNLAVNARDAMPDGGRLMIETSRIVVSTDFAARTLSVEKGTYLALSVTDTGTGMPPEVQARLFEPFFTTKEQGKGTGLGLSTVYGIVKHCGGAITVHSTVGIGTSVRVLFPAIDGQPVEPQEAPVEVLSRGDETVLLVEDEPGVRNYVREILEEQGYRVLDAANGRDAIEMARRYTRTRIGLLLTDMVLPGLNGGEVIRKFRELHPGVPAIRMSGYPERFGAQLPEDVPYLAKPFPPEVLLSMVRKVLDGAQSAVVG
jgi:PAS domain S-box-containing protein